MTASEIERTLVRLAHQVLERYDEAKELVFIGIRRRGVPLAERLAAKVGEMERATIPVGSLDINLYRDDLSMVGNQPVVSATHIPFSITDKIVVLVDDVLYTGRTCRSALNALFDHGRPRRVDLLVLIDRGHRELPVEAGFVGRTLTTTETEIVEVKLNEIDQMEKVVLVERVDG